MKRSIFAILCLVAAGVAVWAQAQNDSLATLIQQGNRKAALDRIASGADVNESQPDGTRPVHWAVFRADHEVLQALIAKKVKVDVSNEFGSTPLAEAVKLADVDAVKMLLAAGAAVNSANEDGEVALMLAIKTGELPVVEAIVNAGANVNAVEKFQNQTPLMYAAAAPKNAGSMVKLLLSKGANVKARAKFTDWPSQISSEPRAQYRPVGGLTALLYAGRSGCYECVDAMLGAGADVNLPTPEGVTPLMMAIDNGHNDVAKLFLDKGANPNVFDWWGRTALYITVERKAATAPAGRGGRGATTAAPGRAGRPAVTHMDLIDALLAAGVDPNPQMNMHRPSRGGNSGRFGESQLSTGATPLFRAAQANDTAVMQALLAKGANPNINAMGFTPFLIVAGVAPGGRGGAANGTANTAMMDLMIQKGADVNTQVTGTKTYSMRVSRAPSTNEGMTPLHVAVQAGRAEMVKYLLEKGARTQIADANGRRPIDLLAGTAANPTTPAEGARPGGGTIVGGGAGGGRGPTGPSAATIAEIRSLLEAAPAR